MIIPGAFCLLVKLVVVAESVVVVLLDDLESSVVGLF